MQKAMKLITVKDVLKITGYKSRTTLWRRVKAGDFPKPISLSVHATRWKEHEVEEWINSRPELKYGSERRIS